MTEVWIKSLLRSSVTLQAIITMVFALLILPALAIVIGFSFYENVTNLTALSNRFIDGASQDAARNVRTSSSTGRRGRATDGRSGGNHAGVLPVRRKFKLSL